MNKQQFLDRILEVGEGRPIYVERDDKKLIYEEWLKSIRSFAYYSDRDEYAIFINHHIANPPVSTDNIEFYDKSRIVLDIPHDIANESINKLKFLEPIESTVILPDSAVLALHAFSDEPSGKEWGGGIDFEIIDGKPEVERIVAYLAEKNMVPWRVIRKYQDIEVRFHTHPNKEFASPSVSDIYAFVESKQQVEFIVTEKQILILTKTKNTPDKLEEDEIEERTPRLGYTRYSKKEQIQDLRILSKNYGIKWEVIDFPKDVKFDINVVRGKAKV